nr:hypothetical protein HK105_005621 [Polyrhizophydium stewartii]
MAGMTFAISRNYVTMDPTSGAVRHRFFIDSAKPQDDLVFGKLWNKVREQSGMSVEAQDAGTPKDEQKK